MHAYLNHRVCIAQMCLVSYHLGYHGCVLHMCVVLDYCNCHEFFRFLSTNICQCYYACEQKGALKIFQQCKLLTKKMYMLHSGVGNKIIQNRLIPSHSILLTTFRKIFIKYNFANI